MDIEIDEKWAHAATGGCQNNADEPAVVFVHGAGMNRTAWQLQARNVAHNGRRVFAVDLPGHGRSQGQPLRSITEMADWLALFMEASETGPATIIGHSMGALVALDHILAVFWQWLEVIALRQVNLIERSKRSGSQDHLLSLLCMPLH